VSDADPQRSAKSRVEKNRLQHAFGHGLRTRRGRLSQEVFADLLGVHRTYLGALERGEHNITLRTVERLAERAGVDAIELLSTPT
jgi:transcriptional regulator with XRE-family HTH domain